MTRPEVIRVLELVNECKRDLDWVVENIRNDADEAGCGVLNARDSLDELERAVDKALDTQPVGSLWRLDK